MDSLIQINHAIREYINTLKTKYFSQNKYQLGIS